MNRLLRGAAVCLGATFLISLAAAPARAQEAQPQYMHVISANPFGLLAEFFNAEFERVVGPASTAGLGGSFAQYADNPYYNVDVFWRYYLSGRPFEGWNFGAKAGLTRGEFETNDMGELEPGTYFGLGFDVNRSWLLGANDNFYVGIGFGLKRLLGVSIDDFPFVPAIRIVNIGFAF